MTCLSHKGLNFWGNCIRAQCPRDEALQCRHKRQNKRNWPIDSINILFSKYSWQRYTASFSSIAGIKSLPQIAKRLSQHLVMVPSWLRKNALCLCQLAFSNFAQCRKWFRDKQLDWFDLHYFILFLTSNSDLTIYYLKSLDITDHISVLPSWIFQLIQCFGQETPHVINLGIDGVCCCLWASSVTVCAIVMLC